MKLTKPQLYAFLLSILFVWILHNYCSILAINIFLFFDNLFQFGPVGSPLILWSLFGLLVGAIYGAIIAWKKYTLDFKLNLIPITLILLFGILLFLLNQPLKNGISLGAPFMLQAAQIASSEIDTSSHLNAPLRQVKSNYTSSKSNAIKYPVDIPNTNSKATILDVKSYTGNVGRLSATFNIMWMSDGTIQGTYYCDSRAYKIYALRGRKLSSGELEMNEYTDNTISAHCSLSFSGNCFIGRMNNTDGRSFDIKMCDKTTTNSSVFHTPGKFPEASDRILTNVDLSRLSKQDLLIMRNEIYARHGYIFHQDNFCINYFNKQTWYHGNYEDVSSMLTTNEIQNLRLILKYESL